MGDDRIVNADFLALWCDLADVICNPLACCLAVIGIGRCDGKYTEISTGKKVNPASRDLDVKQVTGSGLEVKLANQKLAQLQTDVERIFNGLQMQFPQVTPAMVKNVYQGKPAIEEPKLIKPAASEI